MNKRYSFAAGAVVAGVGVAALLLGLPGVEAEDGGAVAVHAGDYAFKGVPATLPVGEHRISFTNDSQAEAHQMELFRLNDGVKESFEQILAEDEAREAQLEQQEQAAGQEPAAPNPPAEPAPPPAPKMTYFGGTGAGPGEAARMDLIGNLPAGRYGVVCFLPVAGDEAGTPHYKKGMKAEFTVG
ncbi:MAG TPA: hypothetical protein VFS16_17165 [Acidimicrobiia bacterium]|nr:hypothetical protein [Acidimicrobiia bacterium]